MAQYNYAVNFNFYGSTKGTNSVHGSFKEAEKRMEELADEYIKANDGSKLRKIRDSYWWTHAKDSGLIEACIIVSDGDNAVATYTVTKEKASD